MTHHSEMEEYYATGLRVQELEAQLTRLTAERDALRVLLREARQYVDDAGVDEDPETQRNTGVLLREVDAALGEAAKEG